MVDLAGLEVRGTSVGGIATCLEVPEWRLTFDLGRASASAVSCSTVLFTHSHADHMGAVAQHAALRALQHMSPPVYVVPRVDAEAFRDLFAAWRRLDRSELPHRVVELAAGEEYAVGRDLVACPFPSPHRAPCQGYVIHRERRKLLPRYAGLAGAELARLRREGTAIDAPLRTAELAFTGDTTIEVLDRVPELLRVRRLILEVTFLDERVDVASARARGHVHLDEVVERADRFENEALLFTHFSARYRCAEVVALLDARLPPGLRARVTPMLDGWA